MFTNAVHVLSTPAVAGALSEGGLARHKVLAPPASFRGVPMPSVLSPLRSRAALLVSACGLALMQTACAHPVMVEPSVVVHGRIGGPVYGSVYAGPLYGPPPVVVAPQPMWMPPPPPVVMAPRVMPPPPAYYAPRHHHWHGQGLNHGWGRRGW